MSKKSYITSEETPRNYRTEIPNIVFELLELREISHSDFILYSVYRRIAGENGASWVGTRTLEKKCGLKDKTITNSKKNLSKTFKSLNGKSLIKIQKRKKQKETSDIVTIVDIWQENHTLFKNKLQCSNPDDGGVVIRTTEERTIKNIYINPPPPTPPPCGKNKSPKSITKSPQSAPQSLRSEEDIFYACLNETNLSPTEKRRLSRKYPEDKVAKAVELSKTQAIKKTLMHLLVNILDNPEEWKDRPKKDELTPQQRLAVNYSRKLQEVDPALAHKNESAILEGYVHIIEPGLGPTTVSLKWYEFETDIRTAEVYLCGLRKTSKLGLP